MTDKDAVSFLPLSRRARVQLGLLLAFWFVWSQADHIADFFGGVSEGISETRAAHRN